MSRWRQKHSADEQRNLAREREGDRLDVREDVEPTLAVDETGDAYVVPGERLGADHKQSAGEGHHGGWHR